MGKPTSKEMFKYVALFGVLILVAVYFLVYKKYMDLTTQVEASNRQLSQRVQELKVYYDNEAQYIADTETMKQQMAELLAPFPADAREEDAIMKAVEMQEASPIIYSSINIAEKELKKEVAQSVVLATAQEEYSEAILFKQRDASYNNELTYFGLKDALQLIYDSEYPIGIRNITYSRGDDSGVLVGVIDLAFYSIEGIGKEYVLPAIPEYNSGTENIFGNITTTNKR